jgi:hypothetical protein
MMIHISLTQLDMLEGKETLLADGTGDLKGDKLVYRELEAPGYLHEVTFTDREIVLKRKAEITSITKLTPMRPSESVVESPFGVMRLETRLNSWLKNDDCWSVEYQVLSGSDIVLHQRLTWNIKGAAE